MMKKIVPSLLVTAFVGMVVTQGVFAQDTREDSARARFDAQGVYAFDKDVSYDIYYEVSLYEVHRLENVLIQEIVTVKNVLFVVVQFSGMTSRLGYIQLDSIRAILPTGAPRPKRSADLKMY